MEQWSSPATRSYNVIYKNLLGITVLDLTYTVIFFFFCLKFFILFFFFKVTYTYGGRLNGKGRYLDNISIIPTHVSVAWGFTCSLFLKKF
jgi:hypothetical protein